MSAEETNLILELETRTDRGSAKSNRQRKANVIPGVVYGAKEPTVEVQMSSKDFKRLVEKARRPIIDVRLPDGRQTLAAVKEVQYDPVHDRPLHVDLHMIKASDVVTVSIPLVTVGDSKGVKLGGVMDIVVREVEVRGIPAVLPENVVVDVSEMEVGDSVKLGDLVLPAGVELVGRHDLVALTLVPPTTVAETPTAAAAEPAEGAAAAKKEEEG